MRTNGERNIHDFGDLEIVTVKPINQDRWHIAAAYLSKASPLAFQFGTVDLLKTPDTFASEEDAIEFASDRLRLPLRTNGANGKFLLRATGFRGEYLLACE
jgi:hypothetical protein